jgi:hypothetical protein
MISHSAIYFLLSLIFSLVDMQLSWPLPENLGSNALDTTKNKQISIRVQDIQIYLLFHLTGRMISCWLAA